MLWFKKAKPVEAFVQGMVKEKLPRAVQFFDRENDRAHHALNIEDQKLLEIGAGMILFFLGKYYPDKDKKNLALMSRAYKEIEKTLPALKADPKEAYAWWKAFTDGLIFQENEERLRIASRLVWEKLITSKPYREASPLKTFGYFLEMEVQSAEKITLK
jgi:hypothetical protein